MHPKRINGIKVTHCGLLSFTNIREWIIQQRVIHFGLNNPEALREELKNGSRHCLNVAYYNTLWDLYQ